jgi:hypothetical protein
MTVEKLIEYLSKFPMGCIVKIDSGDYYDDVGRIEKETDLFRGSDNIVVIRYMDTLEEQYIDI